MQQELPFKKELFLAVVLHMFALFKALKSLKEPMMMKTQASRLSNVLWKNLFARL
jgi:hypothetical protein